MKTILAAILAGAFLVSTPVLAADKDDSGKAGASGKKSKGDKSDKGGGFPVVQASGGFVEQEQHRLRGQRQRKAEQPQVAERQHPCPLMRQRG